MEASLPSQLQSLTISKVMDYSPDSRLRQILPLITHRQTTSPDVSIDDKRSSSYPIIPLHLNPLEQQPNKKIILNFQSGQSSNKQYHCSYCQKKFMRPSSLKIHTYSHTGEKPFNCSFPGCRRRFSVQSNMRRHLRVHSD